MQKYNKGVPFCDTPHIRFTRFCVAGDALHDSISAEGFSLALGTSSSLPDAVEVVGGGIDQ